MTLAPERPNTPVCLSPEFLQNFQTEGFFEVGVFGLDHAGRMYCQLGGSPILNSSFALYAFVGFGCGGTVLRIGESGKRPISKRILEYPRYINDACDERLGTNGYFAGGTKPWERNGWFEYLRQFQTGIIFGKIVDFTNRVAVQKDILHAEQNALIAKYAPPFCNDSLGSKPLRVTWEAIHGKAQKYYKRPRS